MDISGKSRRLKCMLTTVDEVTKLFHQDIINVIVKDEVPPELVINWDQTGRNYVPVSQSTMEQEGAKRVEIHGIVDKTS